VTPKLLDKEVRGILEMMGHALHYNYVRLVGYLTNKTLSRIYSEILVHDEDLAMV